MQLTYPPSANALPVTSCPVLPDRSVSPLPYRGAAKLDRISDNIVMSNNLAGDSFMVLDLEHETSFTQTLEPPTVEESPRLSEEEAEAFLDAYTTAVVS